MTLPKRTSALATALVGILLAPAATATRGSPEQLVPDALPIPVDSLWLSVDPLGGGAVAWTEGNAAPATFAPTDYSMNQASVVLPRGPVFDFPANRKPFKVASTTRTLLPRVAPSDPSGMTIAFSYRANVGQKDGFYPLWSLGARGAPWRMALVLNDGRPQVSLRHASLQLFDETSVPQAGRTARVDDSEWHHITLRVTREKCSGACPSIVDVGYPVQPARFTLYVDGQWRNEEVALAPLDLDELGLGELAVTSPYAQENFRTGPDRLEAYAMMRDILLFEAPLSDFEIAELEGWTTAGYTAQFPWGARTRIEAFTPGIQTTPFQVGPSPMPPSDLLAYGGRSVGASSETHLTTGATTFAWVKIDQHAPAAVGRFWLGSTSVTVAYTAEGMKATCGSSAVTAPYPRAPLNRPQLLTLISTGGSSTLYQDGYKVLSVPCASPSANGSIGFELQSGTGAWLLWTGSFTRPAPIEEVLRRAAPGPALWNGAKAGDTQLLDLTGRETLRTEPSPLGSRAIAGGRFTNEGAVAAGATAKFPTLPYGFSMAAEGALGPGAGDTPVTVSFEFVDPNARETPWVPVPAGTTPVPPTPIRYQLAAREYWVTPSVDQRVNFSTTVECRWNLHDFIFGSRVYQRDCWYEIVAGVGPGKAGRRFRVNDYRALPTEKHHLAIAWDGKPRTILPGASGGAPVTRVEPLVAIDGKTLNQRTLSDHNPIQDLGEVPALPAATAGVRARWSFGPGGKGALEQALAAADSPWAGVYAVDLYDVRVYPFAHVDVASIYRARGGACAEAGRQSTASAAPWHGDYCGDCAAGQYRLAGTTVAMRECRTPEPYGVDCASSTECEGGGACWQGRCLTTSQTQSQADCAAIGRTSVAQGSSWRCADCKAGLRPKGAASTSPDSWELQCSWQPDKGGGDTCTSDAECKSNWCLPAQSGQVASGVHKGQGSRELSKSDSWGLYDITCRQQAETFAPTLFNKPWSVPRTCAYEADVGAAECQARATVKLERKSTAPDGSEIVGVQCKDGPVGQCLPGFEKRWSVLSPQACVAGLKAATQSIQGVCDVDGWNRDTDRTYLEADPRRVAMWTLDVNRATLKRAFLDDASAWTTADYARLLTAGVGSRLLEYAAGTDDDKYKLTVSRGEFKPLRWCADDFGDRPAHATYANGVNAQVCEPKLRKNGETCPPPGSEGTGFQPWQFCESSFCDVRGTGTCTDGGQVLREDEGDAGNKGRAGKEAVKFGIVRVDDTRIDLSKDTEHAGMGEAAAGYEAALSQTHVPCILGEKFPPVDLMHVELVIDKQKPTCGKTVFTFQVMGVTFNAPPPDPVAGSCTIASATVGTNGEICAEGPSCTPPSWENLKNLASWTGRIPSFKYCIPLDDDTGKAKGDATATPVKQPAPATLPEKKKTILAGPVPIVIGIGLTLDPCVNAAFGFSDNGARHALSQTGLPQLEITPSIAIGVEASAGVGVEEDQGGGAALGVSVGVKIALTIIELRFPIRWGLAITDATDKSGNKVPGLFKLQSVVGLSMAIEILSGWMGLYASISLGPFGIEWVLKVFGWTGIVFQAPLTNPIAADLMTIDFRAALNAALAGQQLPPKPRCDGSVCSGQGN